MLVLGSNMLNSAVLSFHLGAKIGSLKSAIIEPEDLSVRAYKVSGSVIDKDPEIGSILDTRDIREYSKLGLVIDSTDRLVNEDDIIRVKELLELDFELIGLKVVSQDGKKIGKVSDYTLDTRTWSIYQIIVQRPFLKSFIDPMLTINRSQIVEIDDYKITIKHEKEEVKVPEEKTEQKDFIPNYENPFRQRNLAPNENQSSSKDSASEESSSTISE